MRLPSKTIGWLTPSRIVAERAAILGRHLEDVDLAAHDAGGTFVEVAEALAGGGGDNAPALTHEGDDHARQLACNKITDLLEEGGVEVGAFRRVSRSIGCHRQRCAASRIIGSAAHGGIPRLTCRAVTAG